MENTWTHYQNWAYTHNCASCSWNSYPRLLIEQPVKKCSKVYGVCQAINRSMTCSSVGLIHGPKKSGHPNIRKGRLQIQRHSLNWILGYSIHPWPKMPVRGWMNLCSLAVNGPRAALISITLA